MKRSISITLAAASLVSLQACENLTPDQRTVVGLTGGAAAGLITADILNADRDWRVIAALAFFIAVAILEYVSRGGE